MIGISTRLDSVWIPTKTHEDAERFDACVIAGVLIDELVEARVASAVVVAIVAGRAVN